jgi:CRISPR-associated protein Cmr4
MLLYLYAESPVHAGASDSLGALDLPVQREATTTYPVIWGQSLKGALRQAALDRQEPRELVTQVFGSEVPRAGEPGTATAAGLLSVGDAQLVAMPVPTLQRTFAWVTSHLALSRLHRKYRYLGHHPDLPDLPNPADDRGAAASAVWTDRPAGAPRAEVLGPCLVELGDTPDPLLTRWAALLAEEVFADTAFGQLAPKLEGDLLAVGSDVMPMLLKECTEFVARVQLTDGKTVQHGPFYSEYLPTETIMASVLSLRPSADQKAADQEAHEALLHRLLDNTLVRIGGDETLGKGMVWTRRRTGGVA